MLPNTGASEEEAADTINDLRYMTTEYGDYKTDGAVL